MIWKKTQDMMILLLMTFLFRRMMKVQVQKLSMIARKLQKIMKLENEESSMDNTGEADVFNAVNLQ